MESLTDKVALITGGASGLGRATAFALAERGAVIVIADRNEDDGRAVADQLGGHFIAVDVSDLDANRAMVEQAVELAGGIDLVHLNAGVISNTGVGDDFDLASYRRAMGVNLDGVVFGTHAALPALKARGGGAIVATASLAGLTAVPMDPIYSANKHAVVGLARSLGPALAEDNIRFNAVCPGFAESAMTAPLAESLAAAGFPMIPAEDVAAAVVTLFSGDMTGEAWFVQAGREPAAFAFRGIPGPRVAEGDPAPPGSWS
jgi:NAD(P)-dependent dehydrogenase (short-subunit alcohol dehydrogenase family)